MREAYPYLSPVGIFSSFHFFFCIVLDTYRFTFQITHSTLSGKIMCIEGDGKEALLRKDIRTSACLQFTVFILFSVN